MSRIKGFTYTRCSAAAELLCGIAARDNGRARRVMGSEHPSLPLSPAYTSVSDQAELINQPDTYIAERHFDGDPLFLMTPLRNNPSTRLHSAPIK